MDRQLPRTGGGVLKETLVAIVYISAPIYTATTQSDPIGRM